MSTSSGICKLGSSRLPWPRPDHGFFKLHVTIDDALQPQCVGKTPPKLVIESVTPIAGGGQTPEVVIRNLGGQPANITG